MAIKDSVDPPDDRDETRDRIVPQEDCRECSNRPDATGLCIDCFLK